MKKIALIAISLAIFACSDSGSNDNEDTPSSSSNTTQDNSSSSKDGDVKVNSLLLNFTSDYTTGELRWMNTDATSLVSDAIDFAADTRLSVGGGKIFALSNYPGVVACISPEDMDVVNDFNLGDAMAPYEVAVIGNKGYVALNDKDYLQAFDINTCALLNEKIDLGISGAYTASVKASGDTLLVLAQRLEMQYNPAYDSEIPTATKPGLLIRIKANAILDTISLKLWNPAERASVINNGKLIVGASNWGMGNEGIEIVDLTAKTSEVIYDETGAFALALDKENQILYAGTTGEWPSNPAKSINLATKEVKTLPNIDDSFGGFAFDEVGKKLFVGDRSTDNSGLKIYNPATSATTTVKNGDPDLPPYSLAIVKW